MEVITMESEVFKKLSSKIDTIETYIVNTLEEKRQKEESETWIDGYDVCTFLKISDRTLQRLRQNELPYSCIRGKYFYRLKDIKRLLENNLIDCTEENINALVNNHKLYVGERSNLKQNK